MGSKRRGRSYAAPSPSDLPEELLQRVVHACGRATRRVCRQWLAAYGPLRCGLLLTDPTSRRDFIALPPHLSSIRTLALAASSQPPPASPRRPPNPPSIPAALPHTFHRLASLDLDTALLATPLAPYPPLSPYLQSLAPLHPHLTALTLRGLMLCFQPLTTLPDALPALRSLTLSLRSVTHTGVHFIYTDTIAPTLATLRALSQLQHLALHHPPRSWVLHQPTADILPHLAALPPTLTHLDFRLCRLSPDHTPQHLHPLHAAFPNLCALHLHLDLSVHPALDSSLDTLTTALSQRQALTSLHLHLALCDLPSASAVARVTSLHSLRSLSLDPYSADMHAAVLLERLAPSVSAFTSLTRLTLVNQIGRTAALDLARPLAAMWGSLAPTLLHLSWARGSLTRTIVAGMAPLTALQSLALPAGFDSYDEMDVAGTQQAAEALLSLTRLTRLSACSVSSNFASRLLAGIGRLPSLRQLVANAADDGQATSGLASASSALTRVELHCGPSTSSACIRAVAALPLSVRSLALVNISSTTAQMLAQELCRQDGRGLLPLPHSLRVLALGAPVLLALSGQVPAALKAAARRQDCVVVAELPREERHFGCNGYL